MIFADWIVWEDLPSYMVNSPKEKGLTAPIRGLFGLLAPLANAEIFPCSFVRITTRLSYSPTGAVESTIPVNTI